MHEHLRMRSGLPRGNQRKFYRQTQSRIRNREFATKRGGIRIIDAANRFRGAHASRVLAIAPSRSRTFSSRACFLKQPNLRRSPFWRDAKTNTRDACATRSQNVWQTHVHNSGSRSDFARLATKSPSTLDRKTAKIVEPDPDIKAAPTSGCLSNHDFTCARKTNFSNTGRSRSFTKVMSPNFCD